MYSARTVPSGTSSFSPLRLEPVPLESEIADVMAHLRSHALARLAPLPLGVDVEELVDTLAGGKLLRAKTVLLVAHAYGGPDPDFATAAATALELLHTASLLHDDIIDDSRLRRGRLALHAAAGPSTAILVADLLIALAFEIAAPLGDRASVPLAMAFGRLCEGQLVESALDWGAEALPAIERYSALKTGSLFGAAFQLGAEASRHGARQQSGFREAGQRLGLAFQLLDDLRDVRADAHELGKDHGADLRNGVPTFPLWNAYRHLEETRQTARPDLPDRLAETAGSQRVLRLTTARISGLVEESYALLPPADRPEVLDLTARTVLTGLEQFIIDDETEAP